MSVLQPYVSESRRLEPGGDGREQLSSRELEQNVREDDGTTSLNELVLGPVLLRIVNNDIVNLL